MTLILGAMDGEIAAFLQVISSQVQEKWHGFAVVRGTLDARQVVVSKSGVGKSLSAAVTQHLMDRYAPSRVIFTGLAGAIAPEIEPGDTLVARDCLQYDLDATALGFKLGEVPYTPYRILTSDPALVEIARHYQPAQGRLMVGRVLTGDRFLVESGAPQFQYLRRDLEGDAVEMEGASVALVATVNRVPFLIVRTISDRADGNADIDFNAFLADASRNSLACVRHILAHC